MDKFCEEKGFIGWYETSAKENINIDEASSFLVQKVRNTLPEYKYDASYKRLGENFLMTVLRKTKFKEKGEECQISRIKNWWSLEKLRKRKQNCKGSLSEFNIGQLFRGWLEVLTLYAPTPHNGQTHLK